LSCIFSGLIVAPGIDAYIKSLKGGAAADQPVSLFDFARKEKQNDHDRLLSRSGGGENPYVIHQELGAVMTKAATVVRHNHHVKEAYAKVQELEERTRRASLSDTGAWTNQNVVFTKALRDMFPLAKTILKGALLRDECRGAHYKPDFEFPGIAATDPAQKRRDAEAWCNRFEENTRRWLKTTVAKLDTSGEPQLTYEDVDTSLIPPRPRLYGLVGAEVIDEVWRERQRKRVQTAPATDGNGEKSAPATRTAAAAAS
jgi:succinate dehydrogenase flavoprotein subunit